MEESFFSAKGRIRRTTFWVRWLIIFVINLTLRFIQIASDEPSVSIFTGIISLILSIFMIIQVVKRMHDINKSGWYGIIPIYNIILAFTAGTIGPNDYGDDPKGNTQHA